MIKTLIIGTGNLSSSLEKKIKNTKIYAAKDFIKNIQLINKKKINLIINSFYCSANLNNLTSFELFVKKTLSDLAKILDLLNPKIINKIIYTSSSSVYGLKNVNKNFKDDNNRYIYAAFKFAAEFLIKNYCKKKNIPFIICRIFNLYSGRDKFSLIYKLKKTA